MKAKRFLACLMAVLTVFAFMPNLAAPAYAEDDTWSVTVNMGAHMTVFSSTNTRTVTKGQAMEGMTIVISRTSEEVDAGTTYKFGSGSDADFITGNTADLKGLHIEKDYEQLGPESKQWCLYIYGTPEDDVTITLNDAVVGTDPAPETWNVAITVGSGMAIFSATGEQEVLKGQSIAPRSIVLNSGYVDFDGTSNSDFVASGSLNGLTITKQTSTVGPMENVLNLRIFGTPTANVTITLKDAIAAPTPKATVTAAPTPVSDLEYTGEAQALLNNDGTSDSTNGVEYSLNGTTWGTAIPTGTEVGDYTVYYRAAADDTHTAGEAATLTASIAKMELAESNIDITVATGSVYTGQPLTPAVTVAENRSGKTLTSSDYTVSYSDNTDAGEAHVTVTAKTNGNYTFEAKMQNFDIAQAKPTINIRDNWTVASETITLEPTATFNGTTVPVTWSYVSGTEATATVASTGVVTPVSSNPGDDTVITITATPTGYPGGNFDEVTKDVTVTITNLEPRNNFTLSERSKDVTYGVAPFTLTTTGQGEGNDVTYESSNPDVADVNANGVVTIKKAGNATITATATATATLAEATDTCTITVAKKDVTVTAKGKNIKVGEAAPDLTSPIEGTDYTVDGLLSTDSLGVDVYLVYATTPDTSVAGSVTIRVDVSGGSDKYNFIPVDGTLTISNKSSGHKPSSGGSTGDTTVTPEPTPAPAPAPAAKTFSGEGGNVEISSEAMAAIAEQAGGADVSVNVAPKTAAEAAAQAGDALAKAGLKAETLQGCAIADVNVMAGSKLITTFGGKTIRLAIPVRGSQEVGQNYRTVAISKDGSVDNMTAQIAMSDGQKVALVDTTHTTLFIVTNEKANNPFTDVTANDYFFQPVMWAVDNGVTSGLSDTVFGPNAGCTRAQMVTFLWRAAGKPWASANKHFSDVADGAYYKDAIEWAVAAGITNGISDALFNPDGAVTREQLASFIYRYAQSKDMGFTGEWSFKLDFSDASAISAWADEAMHWCVDKEIVGGTGNGKLNPQLTATRGQIVTMLYRFFNL